jgi:hypothetical protein
MADEARNTSKRPRGVLGQDAKLRHRPVTFVSAGFMDPLKELKVVPPDAGDVKPDEPEPTPDEVDQGPGRAREDSGKVQQNTIPDPACVEPTPRDSHSASTPAPPEDLSRASSPPQLFIVDTAGDKSLRPDQRQPATDLPGYESDQNSDSSEEVILFKGRGAALRKAAMSRARASPKPKESDGSIQLREIDVALKVVEKTIAEDQAAPAEEVIHHTELPQLSTKKETPTATPKPPEKKLVSLEALLDNNQSDEEAALIADYIANMDTDEEEDGEENDAEADAHPGLGSHAFHRLRDLGGSDSDAIPEAVSEEDTSDDEQEEEVGSSDARQRKMELEDERMARILAKQEELGLGSDDIVLYDDADSEDDQGEWQLAPKSTPRRKKGSTKKAKIIQKKGQYPSATAMADAFDDLDLVDWQRASLDNFNQSTRRSSRVHHASDSELEEAMNLSFQKDRLKKAEKKKEREALRALGLLGKKVKPDDLRVKYPGGMAKEDIQFELEQFLIGTAEQ